MRILLLGSNGMAGHVIHKFLSTNGYEVDTLARSNAVFNIDVENRSSVIELIEQIKHKYDYIINCIGLLVKDSIDRPDRAVVINAWFPHAIENLLKYTNTKFIHLSTDCVFDGKKGYYIESDTHTETNMYGKSKSLGEINNEKDITFRMSIIGPELKQNGTGLLHWFLNVREEICGWDNALWNGITTLQLAKCIELYINNPKITGVYHVVSNKNQISKYDLLVKINEIYNLKKTIIKTQGAKPVNKILIDTRNEFEFAIPDYDVMIKDLYTFSCTAMHYHY